MAAMASWRTAFSMVYYSAQRYDPQLRQQQPALSPTMSPILLRHLPLSFRTSRTSHIPSTPLRTALLSRPGTPSLLTRGGSTTSSSNRGSSSQGHDEYSGRISALTNTTIFEADEPSSHSSACGDDDDDDPAFVKEPDPGERQTRSIESMLDTIQLKARVVTPPPSPGILHPDDTIEEVDEKGKDKEISEQLPSDPELPDLASGPSSSASKILDEFPDYDSAYDSSEEGNETISDFFVDQDPDICVDDTACSIGHSTSMPDVQVSVSSGRANRSLPSSLVCLGERSVTSLTSSVRPIGSSTSLRQATIPPDVYERQPEVNFELGTSDNSPVPSRRVTFADPVSAPSPPMPRAHKTPKAVAWWKFDQLNKRRKRFYLGPSRQQYPEATKPDAPSQPISSAADPIATSSQNVEARASQPPSSPRSSARGIRRGRTRINFGRVVSTILPCIPTLQEHDESDEAEPKEGLRSNGIFSNPLDCWRKKNKNKNPAVQDMVEVKKVEVRVNQRVVIESAS